MSSPPALVYDTYYHIYNRGTNRENIFVQERNYDHFMRLYARHIDPIADTFAYCLLRNHFHLLVRIKSEDEILRDKKTLRVSKDDHANQEEGQLEKPLGSKYPSDQFSNFFNAYAKAINHAYGRTGSLFQHPFGRIMVTNDRQFWNVIAYIHQNPQKHGFVKDFRDWKYSSYGLILSEEPTHLQRNYVMDWFGGKERYRELHSQWVTDEQVKRFVEDDSD
jgi:putative transposase